MKINPAVHELNGEDHLALVLDPSCLTSPTEKEEDSESESESESEKEGAEKDGVNKVSYSRCELLFRLLTVALCLHCVISRGRVR